MEKAPSISIRERTEAVGDVEETRRTEQAGSGLAEGRCEEEPDEKGRDSMVTNHDSFSRGPG